MIDNPFGDEGAFHIAAMLKTNDRLTSISTYCMCVSVVLNNTHSICMLARSIGVAGTIAIIAALKTNRTIVDVFTGDGTNSGDCVVFRHCAD
jgi:hypothetical protein